MENLLTKEHRFFERMLNNDLHDLQSFLMEKYNEIENVDMVGITELFSRGEDSERFLDSKSISTIKWREYNVFALYHEGIANLFLSIRELLKEACVYYNIDFDKERFYIAGWFNVVEASKGKLDWHDHGEPGSGFHGYYCVNAEPSITYYNIFNKKVFENHNINNRAILSEIGHDHAMGDWSWDGKRITIAYDIFPFNAIKGKMNENHFIPIF
jgi:hypothetical protein